MTAKPATGEGERLAIIETQLKRVVSDMESEKRTRSEVSREINEHLLRQDTKIDSLGSVVSKGLGVVVALQFIVPILVGIALAMWKK